MMLFSEIRIKKMMKKILLAIWMAFSFSWAVAQVDINKATAAELRTLKGIGEKKAADIIAYREQNGGFRSVDELKNVKGIGQKTVDKLRPEITVSGVAVKPTTARSTQQKGRRIAVPATDKYRY